MRVRLRRMTTRFPSIGLDGHCFRPSLPPPRPCWPRWAWRTWTRTWPWRYAPVWWCSLPGHRLCAGQARSGRLAKCAPSTAGPSLFLTLSGLATGLSWICYFRALQLGPASRVAPLDKLSVPLVIVFAWLLLGEKFNAPVLIGGLLITDPRAVGYCIGLNDQPKMAAIPAPKSTMIPHHPKTAM